MIYKGEKERDTFNVLILHLFHFVYRIEFKTIHIQNMTQITSNAVLNHTIILFIQIIV